MDNGWAEIQQKAQLLKKSSKFPTLSWEEAFSRQIRFLGRDKELIKSSLSHLRSSNTFFLFPIFLFSLLHLKENLIYFVAENVIKCKKKLQTTFYGGIIFLTTIEVLH